MNSESLNLDSCNCNYIKESVSKIDKLQKEVVSESQGSCITCEASLFTSANNTIPVSFYTASHTVRGIAGLTSEPTQYFRIESLRCNRYVTLRLLSPQAPTGEITLTATDYTMILDLDSVNAMQCFAPISVEVCTQSTTV